MSLILNHIISFTNAGNIDSYLKKWKKAGFVVGKKTVRHEPGLRNGFVYFGPEYIEFCWVEDSKSFRKNAKKYRKDTQRMPSPYGLAFESTNVETLHSQLRKRGYKVPPLYSKGPRGADKSVIWWTFQDIPFHYLPGAWTFALTYELRKNQKGPRRMAIGKNSLYAISGLTLVTKFPAQRAETWKKFIVPKNKLQKTGSDVYRFTLGPHFLEWTTPNAYERKYGIRHLKPGGSTNFREIALIHLLAANLSKAKSFLKRNNFPVRDGKGQVIVGPMKSDGFVFSITEKKPKMWQRERVRFGQKFIINH